MERRALLIIAGGLLAMPAGVVSGQQRSPFRLGWIASSREEDGSQLLDALRQGLKDLGYAEGRTYTLQAHWGDDSSAHTERLVAELVASRPQVIVTQGPSAQAVSRATTTIPVVFGFSGDPVEAGFVQSLARPGGNLTGVSFLALDLVGKRIELLKEVMPTLRRIAVIAWPQHPGNQAERQASQAAAATLGVETEYFEARGQAQLDGALAAIARSRCEAVVLFPVSTVIGQRRRIAAWAIEHRRPTISGWAQFAEGGNLMSYGPNLREASRRLASFVDRILRGARPAEIPVELPTLVELVVNRKTAKALELRLPQSLLVRADRVVE